jgi:CO/xanthine dehydrogenase Mo-binding subunit
VAAGGWPGGTAPAAALCRADSDGTFYLHVGSIDITGTNTALTLIAAEVLGIDPDDIRVINGDSSVAPQSGPSGGSMVTYTVGSAVREAAEGARAQILDIAADMLEAAVDDLEIGAGVVSVKGSPGAELSVKQIAAQGARFAGKYPPITAHGRSAITTQSPGFTVQLVEVAVDRDIGRYRVVDHVVFQDVGTAINPPLIAGQIHGGAAQGLGWAMQEQLVYDDNGTLTTGSFSGYLLPEATQVPDVEAVLIENPSPVGPLGARGVGEPPIIAVPAAVANAVRAAVGARVTELPITSERVWSALRS